MKKTQITPERPSQESLIELCEGGTTVNPDAGFDEFRDKVKKRIEKYQTSKGQDEESVFNTTEEIPAGALFMR